MNEIIFSRLCYLVANPEEAVLRLMFIAKDDEESASLVTEFRYALKRIKKILSNEERPSVKDFDSLHIDIAPLIGAIERDFNKKDPMKESDGKS